MNIVLSGHNTQLSESYSYGIYPKSQKQSGAILSPSHTKHFDKSHYEHLLLL